MDEWRHRHFAKYENGEVFAFENGTTSWSADSNRGVSAWEQTKLAEPQKAEHDGCVGCKFEHFESDQEPCKDCQHAHMDKYEPQE